MKQLPHDYNLLKTGFMDQQINGHTTEHKHHIPSFDRLNVHLFAAL